jgi:hypothetical protein
MTHLIRFVCICDKDWCRCTNRVPTQGGPCLMCQEGAHQAPPDPVRPVETDEEPWFPDWLENERPEGCIRNTIIFGALIWAVIIAIILVIRRLVGW